MLKKFLKSKVFVLSMLVASVGSEVRGMDFNFPDENNGPFGNDFYFFDGDLSDYNFNFDGDSFFNMFEDQGNDESIQGTNAAPQMPPVITAQTNQPMSVTDDNLENANPLVPAIVPKRNPKYYPPNWDSSGAGQFFYEHPEYNVSAISLYHLYTQVRLVGLPDNLATLTGDDRGNTLQVRTWFADNWDIIKDYVNEAIQTNPQTHSGAQVLCPDGWAGSDAEKFCIDLGLTSKGKIYHFVANAQNLGYEIQAIPGDAVEGRRVFMNEVYPVLVTLSDEEIQRIASYRAEPKITKEEEAAINKRWKESKIGRYAKDANLKKAGLIVMVNDLSKRIPELNKVSRKGLRNSAYLKRSLLQCQETILRLIKPEDFRRFKRL